MKYILKKKFTSDTPSVDHIRPANPRRQQWRFTATGPSEAIKGPLIMLTILYEPRGNGARELIKRYVGITMDIINVTTSARRQFYGATGWNFPSERHGTSSRDEAEQTVVPRGLGAAQSGSGSLRRSGITRPMYRPAGHSRDVIARGATLYVGDQRRYNVACRPRIR